MAGHGGSGAAAPWFTLRVDGASRGNPGPAAIGVVLEGHGAREEIGEFIGVTTNNVAEYRALIRGLEAARARGVRRVRVFSDCELLVRQLRGEYRVKSEQLQGLAAEARRLLAGFEAVELRHVPRSENALADRLANAALDARAAPVSPRLAPPLPSTDADGCAGQEAAALRRVALRLVDAFTDRPLTGNAAGVVPDAGGLGDAEMQALARELGASETAFVLPSSDERARFRLRFFTPRREVPLCGHATLAAVHVLTFEGRLALPDAGRARFLVETGAGLLGVLVDAEGGAAGAVWLELAEPRFRPCPCEAGEVAAALGLAAADLHPALPPVLAYSGLWHLLVPLAAREALARAEPDQARLAALNARLGVHTTHVYAAPPEPPVYRTEARAFAPVIGVAEDPQTGTANGALGAWLAHRGWLVRADGPGDEAGFLLSVEQGSFVGRPGEVHVRVEEAGEGAGPDAGPRWRVAVGGRAVIAVRGEAFLPPAPGCCGPG